MNIQANLPGVNLIPTPKKTANKSSTPDERLDQKQITDKQEGTLVRLDNIERAELFQQVKSLNGSQKTSFTLKDLNNKNQQFIQSYLDNQALESQALRDELHAQLGVDFSV